MSQNQFPGQGGQQFPQQGGGQQFPQQGGGQQFPPGGQPNPQQGGYPQGGQQFPQRYPQGQQPAQGGKPYPPGGQPYPQGGYPTAGQYPPAGASGPFGGQAAMGQRPGYPGGGGFQPQPPRPKGNGMVIGIVVAGLAAVALAGWLLMSIFGSNGGDPTPSVSPTASAPPTPQPSPSTDQPNSPSPQPTPSTSTNPPAGGALEVGLGVSVTPADGWRQSSRDELKSYTELTNGKALLATQAFRVDSGVTGKDVVAAYMKQITANMTGVSSKPAATMDVKSDRLSVGIGSWSGTRATAQGSIKLSYLSIISVRDDGLAVMSTLILPPGVGLDSVQTDYTAMTNSLLNSQLRA